MNNDSSHAAINIEDSATGQKSSVIVDGEGHQVHLGDEVGDDAQGLLNMIGRVLSGEEGDPDAHPETV